MNNDAFKQTSNTETVTISRAEYEELLSIKSMNEWLVEQLKSLKKGKFGSSSERSSQEVVDQLSLFDEAEAYAFIEEMEVKRTTVAEHQRVTKERRFLLDKIPEGTEKLWSNTGFPKKKECATTAAAPWWK